MRYSRLFMSLLLSAVMLISTLVVVSGGEMESEIVGGAPPDAGSDAVPTRSIYPYIEESESNNGWSSADRVSNTMSIFEIHGNISNNNDHDFFSVDLDGGSGPVHQFTLKPNYIKVRNDYDYLIIWFFAFTPEIPNEEVVLSLGFYDVTRPTTWKTITVHASYTGTYGFRFSPYNATGGSISGNIRYNVTATISSVTPRDSYNDIGSASSLDPGKSSISGTLDQWLDTYDWYHVSAPSDLHPTEMDLKFSIGATNPDYAYNNIAWGVELDLMILYNSRSSPNFQTSVYRISKNSDFQAGGAKVSPYYLDLYKNCTEIYIGVGIHAYGISQLDPDIDYKTYTDFYQADAAYTMDLDISADIPNNRPTLLDGKVEPLLGDSSDLFEFSVTYRDRNNETPKRIELWLDGEFARNLAPLQGQEFDFTKGVRYGVTLSGASIGANVLHEFNFTASDGEDVALFYSSGMGPFPGPRVDDNQAPFPVEDPKKIQNVPEDTDIIYLELDTLFIDDEPETDFYYDLLTENGEWGDTYREEDIVTAKLTNGTLVENNNVLTIWPEENIHGEYTFIIRAADGPSSDPFTKYAEMVVELEIDEINDPPEITRIDQDLIKENPNPTYDFYQGDKEEIPVRAEDVDGDDLTYSWDMGDILASAKRGVNYDWDEETGELWFITSDGDVPEIRPTLTVTDSRGLSTSLQIPMYIENINDPPYIEVPEFKSTIEGEYLYIIPIGGDPDLDDGDFITYSYDLGQLSRYTPSKAVEFNPNTGRLQIEVVSEDMIGEWEIRMTVVDLSQEYDTGTCRVVIQNVNDIPVANDISYNSQDQNLTVVFFTSEAEDEDENEELIYIWNFGDGSPEVSGINKRTVTHVFPSAGAFSVSLKVFDGEAYSEVREKVLTLTAPPVDPDLDNDGMLDEWEKRAGLDPTDPGDALIDTDQDGMLNKEEFDYWEQNGVYLNPNNPDTDMDGYKDGEEVNGGFDPLSPESHPDPEYATVSLVMMIMGGLFFLLAFIFLVLFLVLRKRNNPKVIAMPVAASPVDGNLVGAAGYQQLPGQAGYQELPPASGVDGSYQQPQAGITPEQDAHFGQDMYQGGVLSTDQFMQGPTSQVQAVPYSDTEQPPDAALFGEVGYGGPVSPPDQAEVEPFMDYAAPELYSPEEFNLQEPPSEIQSDPMGESDPLARFMPGNESGPVASEGIVGEQVQPEASGAPDDTGKTGTAGSIPPLPPLPKPPGSDEPEI
ncbi:MAG: PKD domain-containing protein [Thermoplasmatota archaeon]